MKAATIFFGLSGYMQIGYFVENGDNELEFHLRCVIVIDKSWVMMNAEETSFFFSLLRSQEECVDVEVLPDYMYDGEDVDFSSFFTIEKNGESRSIHVNGKEQKVTFPNANMMRHVLSFGPIINGHLEEKHKLRSELTGDIDFAIHKLAKQCRNHKTPFHIKYMAKYSSDEFVVELSTSFFSIFCWYYHNIEKY